MNIPDDLKFTKDHEWGRIEGPNLRVGITDFAQSELGDIVFVELKPVGTRLKAGDPFGTVESVKAVSDLYAPVSGTIVEQNVELEQVPELVNQDCYGAAWMIVLAMDDVQETGKLMDAKDYTRFVTSEAR